MAMLVLGRVALLCFFFTHKKLRLGYLWPIWPGCLYMPLQRRISQISENTSAVISIWSGALGVEEQACSDA